LKSVGTTRPELTCPHRVAEDQVVLAVARAEKLARFNMGLPLRPGGVTAAFEAHVAACALPVIRLHDTRHGACSLLLAGGVPIEIVQMILGHSSPEVTRRVYAHLMRRAAAEQVETATELLTKHRRRGVVKHDPQLDVSNP
jgi:integrase